MHNRLLQVLLERKMRSSQPDTRRTLKVEPRADVCVGGGATSGPWGSADIYRRVILSCKTLLDLAQRHTNIVKLIVVYTSFSVSVPKSVPAHHALLSLTPTRASPAELLQKPSPASPNQVSELAALRSDTNAGAVKPRRTSGWWSSAHGRKNKKKAQL